MSQVQGDYKSNKGEVDPLLNLDSYLLTNDTQRVIRYADNLIKFKSGKKGRGSKVKNQNSSKKEAVRVKWQFKDKDNKLKKSESNSSVDSYSDIDLEDFNPTLKPPQFSTKIPRLCAVGKIALKFIHSIYKDDPRVKVADSEQLRIKTIAEDDIKQRSDEYYPQNELEAKIVQDHHAGPCSCHGEERVEHEEVSLKFFEHFKAFYYDLLDDKHNKVSREAMCLSLLKVILNPDAKEFTALRKKLTDVKALADVNYEDILKVNPQIILKDKHPKTDKNDDILMGMDKNTDRKYSLSPVKKLVASKSFLKDLLTDILGDEEFSLQNK